MMLLLKQLKWKAREITTTRTKKRKNRNRLSSARRTIMSTVVLEIVMSLAVKRNVDAHRDSLRSRRHVSTRMSVNMEATSAVIRVTMWKAVTRVLVRMVSGCRKTRKPATISTSAPTTTKFADHWSAATHTAAIVASVKTARKWTSMAGATLRVCAITITAGVLSELLVCPISHEMTNLWFPQLMSVGSRGNHLRMPRRHGSR